MFQHGRSGRGIRGAAVARQRGADPVHAAHPRWSWVAVIAGGPALFLAGRTVFGYLVFGYVSAPRPIAIALLGGLTPALVRVPPLLASVVVGPVLLGLLILVPDLRIGRSRREGARPLGR